MSSFRRRMMMANTGSSYPSDAIMTIETNPEVLAICYAKGWCASDQYMTATEASAITTVGTTFKAKTSITHFDELEYFTRLTSIPSQAFDGCINLTSINIPSSVNTIGWRAFANCKSLVSIVIPNSVTSTSTLVFGYCSNLQSVVFSNNLTTLTESMFTDCTALESIAIPNNITTIGRNTFYKCNHLSTVTIGSGVTSIGQSVFNSCSNLQEITILATNPPSLGASSFYGTIINKIYVPAESVTAYKEASDWSSFSSIIDAIQN